MARGRMLNQKISKDIDFNAMSFEAQFIFMRTIPFLDRDGLIAGHPALLWSDVAPLLPEFAPKMAAIIDEWENAGFVLRYMDGKSPVLFFLNFFKNQAGMRYEREPDSEYEPPPGYTRTDKGLVLADTGMFDPIPIHTNGTPPHDDGAPSADYRQITDKMPEDCHLNRIEREKKTTTAREREGIAESKSGSGGNDSETGQKPEAFDYGRIATSFESNGFGMLTVILQDEIGALMEEYPTPWILEAMRVSVSANKRSLRFVHGVLRNWRANGFDPARPPSPPGESKAPEPVVIPAAARALAERAAMAAGNLSTVRAQ